MWILRVLTMQKQLEQLDQQMDKLRRLVGRQTPATGRKS